MTCTQLDDLRDTSAALPGEAREHLRQCRRCRELQALLDSPLTALKVPADLQAGIHRGILGELRPVTPLPSDGKLAVALLVLSGTGIAVASWWLGNGGWHALTLWQALIIFSLLGAGMLFTTVMVTQQMVPGARQMVSTRMTLLGASAALLAAILLLFSYHQDANFTSTGLHCFRLGLLSATGVNALLFLVLRRGAWLSPVDSGASAGFLAGLAGLTVLETCCPYLDRAHISVWHLGATLTATLIGAALGALGGRR